MGFIEILIHQDKSLQKYLIDFYKGIDQKPTKTPWIISEAEEASLQRQQQQK